MHVPRGHEHGKNGDGVPDDIIVQGIQDIAPLTDIEIPLRYDQLVVVYQIPEDSAEISGIIDECFEMLFPAVPLTDERLPGGKKPYKTEEGCKTEQKRECGIIKMLFSVFICLCSACRLPHSPGVLLAMPQSDLPALSKVTGTLYFCLHSIASIGGK